MNVDGFIDLAYVHNALGLGSNTRYDENISLLLEPYTIVTFNLLGIDETILAQKFYSPQNPQVELDIITQIKEVIAARIGCQLYLKDPAFGQKYNKWKVGNVEKGFQRPVKMNVLTWCDYYDEMIKEAEGILGTPVFWKKRRGLINEYNRPY
jgi:hypothetical protein